MLASMVAAHDLPQPTMVFGLSHLVPGLARVLKVVSDGGLHNLGLYFHIETGLVEEELSLVFLHGAQFHELVDGLLATGFLQRFDFLLH